MIQVYQSWRFTAQRGKAYVPLKNKRKGERGCFLKYILTVALKIELINTNDTCIWKSIIFLNDHMALYVTIWFELWLPSIIIGRYFLLLNQKVRGRENVHERIIIKTVKLN